MEQIKTALEAIRDFLKNNFFVLFKEETVPIGLALILLLFGLLFLVYLVLIKWIPVNRQLLRLERVVRSTDGELGFAQQYPQVDEAFSRIKYLRHGWKEFEKSHIMPEDVHSEPIRNTARPAVYINLTSAETAGVRIRFMQAVPNYFVGFGLLFTFIGLVAAIYFASEGIASAADSGDVRETQRSLRNLLNAATFKFLTSVAGIASSLLVAIAYRMVAGNLQARFDRLCDAIEERMRFVTPEWIAFEQYREMQKQTTQLERFNTDLAVQIAEALDPRISTSLNNAIEPLLNTMSGMADKLGTMNQDALSLMLDEFTDKLQAGAGSELQGMAANLSETQVALTQLAEHVSTSGMQLSQTVTSLEGRFTEMAAGVSQALNAGMAETVGRLQSQLEEVGQTLGRGFAEGGAEMREAMAGASLEARDMFRPLQEHIDTFAEHMLQLSEQLSGQITAIQQVNTKLGDVVSGATTAASGLREAVEPFKTTSAEMSRAAQSLVGTSTAMTQLQQRMTELASMMQETATVTQSSWSDYALRFESVDEDLGKTIERFQKGVVDQQNSIIHFVREVDSEVNNALGLLTSGVTSLEEAIEELNDNLQRFRSGNGTQ